MITNNAPSWLAFLIWSLATFRLSLLLSEDSGPFKASKKLRAWLKREEKKSPALKKSDVAHGAECQRCSGVWFSILITLFVYFRDKLIDEVALAGDALLLCMALSAAGILWNRAFPKR